MDGFQGNPGIIAMAATNRADILDAALLRPGRYACTPIHRFGCRQALNPQP